MPANAASGVMVNNHRIIFGSSWFLVEIRMVTSFPFAVARALAVPISSVAGGNEVHNAAATALALVLYSPVYASESDGRGRRAWWQWCFATDRTCPNAAAASQARARWCPTGDRGCGPCSSQAAHGSVSLPSAGRPFFFLKQSAGRPKDPGSCSTPRRAPLQPAADGRAVVLRCRWRELAASASGSPCPTRRFSPQIPVLRHETERMYARPCNPWLSYKLGGTVRRSLPYSFHGIRFSSLDTTAGRW